jgi:hypothetical protein
MFSYFWYVDSGASQNWAENAALERPKIPARLDGLPVKLGLEPLKLQRFFLDVMNHETEGLILSCIGYTLNEDGDDRLKRGRRHNKILCRIASNVRSVGSRFVASAISPC